MSIFCIDYFSCGSELIKYLCLIDCSEFDAYLVEFKDGLLETSDGAFHLKKNCDCRLKPKNELLHEISLLKEEREKLEEERCRLSFLSKDYDDFSKKNKEVYFFESYETELCEIEETLNKIDIAIKHGKMILDFLEEIEKDEEKERKQMEIEEKHRKEEEKKLRIKYAYDRLSSLKSEIAELEQEINELLKD